MKTATEIAKLHSLFLSQDPANWQLAAMMCSEAEFEQVVEMEVERLKLIEADINMDYPSILGSAFSWCLGWMCIDMDVNIFDVLDDLKDVDLKPVTKRWRTWFENTKAELTAV